MSMSTQDENIPFNNSGPFGPDTTPPPTRRRALAREPARRRTRARTNTRGRKSKYWCFTLNNPSEGEVHVLNAIGVGDMLVSYLVFGHEVGENGTPHLQGYVEFKSRWDLVRCQQHFLVRAHYEQRRGTPLEASDYCKKDGNFEEWGILSRGISGICSCLRLNKC